jgi:hypothetical protein
MTPSARWLGDDLKAGNDLVTADAKDKVVGCERVIRVSSSR